MVWTGYQFLVGCSFWMPTQLYRCCMVWHFRRSVFAISVLLLLGDTGMFWFRGLISSTHAPCDWCIAWGWIGAGTPQVFLSTASWEKFTFGYYWSIFCVNIIMTLLIGTLIIEFNLPWPVYSMLAHPQSWKNMVGDQTCQTPIRFPRPTCISHHHRHIVCANVLADYLFHWHIRFCSAETAFIYSACLLVVIILSKSKPGPYAVRSLTPPTSADLHSIRWPAPG